MVSSGSIVARTVFIAAAKAAREECPLTRRRASEKFPALFIPSAACWIDFSLAWNAVSTAFEECGYHKSINCWRETRAFAAKEESLSLGA